MSPCNFKRSFKKILNISFLTETQIKTLICDAEIKGKKVIIDKKVISKGSYYRTRNQAIQNIVRSIMTLAVISYHDIINPNDVANLIIMISSLIEEDIDTQDIGLTITRFIKTKLREIK